MFHYRSSCWRMLRGSPGVLLLLLYSFVSICGKISKVFEFTNFTFNFVFYYSSKNNQNLQMKVTFLDAVMLLLVVFFGVGGALIASQIVLKRVLLHETREVLQQLPTTTAQPPPPPPQQAAPNFAPPVFQNGFAGFGYGT